jgi:hypothetical protein
MADVATSSYLLPNTLLLLLHLFPELVDAHVHLQLFLLQEMITQLSSVVNISTCLGEASNPIL